MSCGELTILYRGPLSSCNYACDYCPFAKRKETRAELESDRRALERFVDWTLRSPHQLSVFFTPWGEALARRWYRDAMIRLSHAPNIRRVAAQTNLSCKLDWLKEANKSKVALWATFHPSEVMRSRFVAQCGRLDAIGIRYSAGVVGLKQHFDDIEALRAELPRSTYVWINAYKREADYYDVDAESMLAAIDPLFAINNTNHASRGQACRTGESVISVDGDGVIRRCHFVRPPIGNIYDAAWERALQPRPCPNDTCGCHIGYVHLDRLGLADTFGDGILERIPRGW